MYFLGSKETSNITKEQLRAVVRGVYRRNPAPSMNDLVDAVKQFCEDRELHYRNPMLLRNQLEEIRNQIQRNGLLEFSVGQLLRFSNRKYAVVIRKEEGVLVLYTEDDKTIRLTEQELEECQVETSFEPFSDWPSDFAHRVKEKFELCVVRLISPPLNLFPF